MDKPESEEFNRVRGIVAARIRLLRQTRGLSQEQLADEAHCHRTYVGMLERSQGNPSLRILAEIAEALGVATAELLIPSSPMEDAHRTDSKA